MVARNVIVWKLHVRIYDAIPPPFPPHGPMINIWMDDRRVQGIRNPIWAQWMLHFPDWCDDAARDGTDRRAVLSHAHFQTSCCLCAHRRSHTRTRVFDIFRQFGLISTPRFCGLHLLTPGNYDPDAFYILNGIRMRGGQDMWRTREVEAGIPPWLQRQQTV